LIHLQGLTGQEQATHYDGLETNANLKKNPEANKILAGSITFTLLKERLTYEKEGNY
jgi:hypothetical protein